MPHVDPSKGTHEIASHKRTVYIDGRKTGVCLEDAFWSTLKEIAQAQGVTVSQTRLKSRAKGGTVIRDPSVRTRPVRTKKVGGYRRGNASPNKRRQLRGLEGGC
jgi:hypothetical protein